MKMLYFSSKGSSDATSASIPLHIAANGSLEVGDDVAVVLVGDATELLDEAMANRLEGVGLPPVRELLAKLADHEVPVYV